MTSATLTGLEVGIFLSTSTFLALVIDEAALFACFGLPSSWAKVAPGMTPSPKLLPHSIVLMWVGGVVALASLVACTVVASPMLLFMAFAAVTFCTLHFARQTCNLVWLVITYILVVSYVTSRLDASLLPFITATDVIALACKLAGGFIFSPKPPMQQLSVADGKARAVDGACMYSPAKMATLLLMIGFAGALEAVTETRLLQPIWSAILAVGQPYVSNSLFAATVATAAYFASCFYFSVLDLLQVKHTKVQDDWFPTLRDMWAAAWPQILAYVGFGQVMVWAQWVYYPDDFTTSLPAHAPRLFELCWHLSVCFVIGDFLIYWEHRLMHTIPYLRKNIHSVHHEYTAVFSWAGGWVHPLEDAVVVLCEVFPVLLLSPHPLTTWLFAWMWTICLIDEHSGHDVWWSPYQILPFTGRPLGGGAAPHDIHHYKVNKNYGFVFIVWDRLFGTFEAVKENPQNPFVPPSGTNLRSKAKKVA